MKLEDIGFYTLSDARAASVSKTSRLWRCELVLTSRCNFRCPYCRGLRGDVDKELTLAEAKHIVDIWRGVKNIRLSGGEPTIWPDLVELVAYAKAQGVERIALSTNGSASLDFYQRLILAGVNDFSISLDACCSSTGDIMAGRSGAWNTVVSNIRALSELTYVTVGVVLTDQNIGELTRIIEFSYALGVADIRIIPAAQFGSRLSDINVPAVIQEKCKILKYRLDNIRAGKPVRGIGPNDVGRCSLVLDDMAVAGGYHFPCIIFLRERGDPIGAITGKTIEEIRQERYDWMMRTDTAKHAICANNCLDVCQLHNLKCSFRKG